MANTGVMDSVRSISKDFVHEIGGKEMKFRGTKLDALHGAWLMKFAAEKILPAVNGAEEAMKGLQNKAKEIADNETEDQKDRLQDVKDEGTKDVINLVVKALENISEEELINFMTRCLQTVKCDLPAGWRPVMVGPSFGVPDLEYDVAGCLALCMDVIEVNLSGFFGGSLSALTQRFRNSAQQGA